MTVSPLWPRLAQQLLPLQDRVDLGVHLTLTGGYRPLGPMRRTAHDGRLPRLQTLMRSAFSGALSRTEIAAEIERQLDAFEVAMGRPPDFVDGHQHVQHFPVVREALVGVVSRRYPVGAPYVRVCADNWAEIVRRQVAIPKTLFVAALSGPLRRLARQHAIPVNDRFRGIHHFDSHLAMTDLFTRFFARSKGRVIVNCHPGWVDESLRAVDPIWDHRELEFGYLAGPDFPADLTRAGVRIARFAEIRPEH